MGMFLNYQNIADNYVPNNLINAFPTRLKESKFNSIEASKPYEEYNAKGEIEGYFWRYGDTLNLEFNIDGEITLEGNALIVSGKGQVPNHTTVGYAGQRLYNITDLKSYTCKAISGGKYLWEEDEVFTYPSGAERSVYVSAEDYLKDKQVEVTIYNFRMEPICKKVYRGSSIIVFSIDKELSNSLVKGIYYCSLRVFSNTTSETIFEPTDCKLLVK
jgi:hypothetical protein